MHTLNVLKKCLVSRPFKNKIKLISPSFIFISPLVLSFLHWCIAKSCQFILVWVQRSIRKKFSSDVVRWLRSTSHNFMHFLIHMLRWRFVWIFCGLFGWQRPVVSAVSLAPVLLIPVRPVHWKHMGGSLQGTSSLQSAPSATCILTRAMFRFYHWYQSLFDCIYIHYMEQQKNIFHQCKQSRFATICVQQIPPEPGRSGHGGCHAFDARVLRQWPLTPHKRSPLTCHGEGSHCGSCWCQISPPWLYCLGVFWEAAQSHIKSNNSSGMRRVFRLPGDSLWTLRGGQLMTIDTVNIVKLLFTSKCKWRKVCIHTVLSAHGLQQGKLR